MAMRHATEHATPWWMSRAFAPVVIGLSVAFVLAGVAILGWHNLAGATPSLAGAQPSGSTLQAYVAGAVARPGVYTLPATDRIHDLVQAAGGARQGADLVRVDLAAPLFDGEEVYVPLIGEPYPDEYGGVGSGICVNINIASATALHIQLGVTTKTAAAIVAYRQAHGPFTAVDQLLLVPVGRTTYDRIKTLVCA